MVFNAPTRDTSSVSEWVAFDGQHNGEEGFAIETIVRNDNDATRPKAVKGESARRRNGDTPSSSSWMKQPINSDSSWAPMGPPRSNQPSTEPPTKNKRRPPRVRTSSGTLEKPNPSHRRQISNGTNPASSDSSSSSAERPSRGRSSERTKSQTMPRSVSTTRDSRRARSRSRSVTKVTDPPPAQANSRRGRSSSRTRSSTKDRDRSTSAQRRASATAPSDQRGRTGGRPPPSSINRRSRSTNSRTPVTATRARSTSRTRAAARPPPSTSRTRLEMRAVPGSSSSVGRAGGSNRSVTSEGDHASLRSAPALDANLGRDISFGRTKSGRALPPSSPSGKRSGFMEKLFGDQVTEEAKQSYLPRHEPPPADCEGETSTVSWQQPEQIHSRILLTATVYHNTATNLWIATINTNQKGVAKNPATASKYLKAFSFSSEKEARESAIANAPPKMMPFNDNPNCFICNGKFAMFRRAGHCRNCGVCICSSCSTMWPSKMIPETYNLKKESQVKICKSCNFLSGSFKKALHDGDYEEAIALYGSGNVNLRTPFPQRAKRDEVVYPIHCGVEGGNIDIVCWLMEDHFCPIKVIRTGSGKKPKRGGSADTPILTSKSRSVLSIAMAGLHVDILRYVVVECGVSIYESKDLKGSLRALEAVLLALPCQKGELRTDGAVHRWDDASFDGDSLTSSLGVDLTLPDETATLGSHKRNADSCIICYDNAINCVMTPCGHQVCCLLCSKNLSTCPVCNVKGQFIKIFRP